MQTDHKGNSHKHPDSIHIQLCFFIVAYLSIVTDYSLWPHDITCPHSAYFNYAISLSHTHTKKRTFLISERPCLLITSSVQFSD